MSNPQNEIAGTSLNALEYLIRRGRNSVPIVESCGPAKTERNSEEGRMVLSRSSDPSTSREAGERAKTFKGKHRAKVWGALKDFGPMNYKQIAERAGLQPVQVGRVLHTMKHLIEPTGEVRDGCQVFTLRRNHA